MWSYRGRTLTGESFKEFVSELWSALPEEVFYKTVYESVRVLAGTKLTSELLDSTCWRLAGNLELLKKLEPVLPWRRQEYAEWVPVQIVKVKLARGGRRGKEVGHELSFRVLAGTSCSHILYQWWSRRRSRYMAYFLDDKNRGFSFSRQRGKRVVLRPYNNPQEFYSLRCRLLIVPKLCTVDGPGFEKISFTSAMTQWNREIHKMRARIEDGYKCPFDFPPEKFCWRCSVGHDRCPAATHAKTYTYASCDVCGEDEAPFDPDDNIHDFCVNCVEKSAFKSEG